MPTLPDILPKKPEFVGGWYYDESDEAWRRRFYIDKDDSGIRGFPRYIILIDDDHVTWSMGGNRMAYPRLSMNWSHRASIILCPDGVVLKNRFNRIGFENE